MFSFLFVLKAIKAIWINKYETIVYVISGNESEIDE